ncbi:MAG: hypothetical protein COW65_07460 [Cytophagales bacterium CG18_big_fil_WC_8_21_14_2_50_42_9]|nr:MAG: hypothetical protein COW65_07460 [Cytophagales bacterium CG18_big_fil_WC_8_21_14_2_50_42_9]
MLIVCHVFINVKKLRDKQALNSKAMPCVLKSKEMLRFSRLKCCSVGLAALKGNIRPEAQPGFTYQPDLNKFLYGYNGESSCKFLQGAL